MSNPAAAFGLLQSSARGPRQVGSVYPIFNAWTERDPSAAVAKAEELPAGQQLTNSFKAIVGRDPSISTKHECFCAKASTRSTI